MQIVSHRGIDKGYCPYFESTHQSFEYSLKNGFGIEFDVAFTKDKKIVIFHDSNIYRATDGRRDDIVENLNFHELNEINELRGKVCLLEEVMALINECPNIINAMHLKGKFQNDHYLNVLINSLKSFNLDNLMVFDVLPYSAKKLKTHFKTIELGPSISHQYDISRFNHLTGYTLLSNIEFSRYTNLYSWVWLDEWDLTNKKGSKKFIDKKTTDYYKRMGVRIGFVSPELHEDTHQDNLSQKSLFSRIEEMINLSPDILCTNLCSSITNKFHENPD